MSLFKIENKLKLLNPLGGLPSYRRRRAGFRRCDEIV